jgi:hypothetical protein
VAEQQTTGSSETAAGTAVGTATEHRKVAARTQLLLDAVRDVTLEDYRSEDAHFERHSRLGRELLYLVANNGWCRRTTEVVDVSHAQAIDTDVIVDVDLAYADHEAFQPDAGITWLPLLALPPMRPVENHDLAGRWSWLRPSVRRRRREDRNHDDPDPITSLEVSDAAGARAPKLPQAEVHQRLAAALAEIILNVMASRAQRVNLKPEDDGEDEPTMERQHKLLLSAAIRRLLPGALERPAERGGAVPAGLREARTRLDDLLSRDITLAEDAALASSMLDPYPPVGTSEGLDPYDDSDLYDDDHQDGGLGTRLRPVLGAHVGEILESLIGTTFVVVAVTDPGHPISYTVHVPSRRLIRLGRATMWFQPRALLSIDLLAPTAHADRLIRLNLPDGVICHDGSAGAVGRIDVVLPAPFERLETLLARLFPAHLPTDRAASWVDGRIAEMALHKVDAALDSLRHYRVTASRGQQADAGRSIWAVLRRRPPAPTDEQLTTIVDRQLRALRTELAAVRRSGSPGVAMDALWTCWDGGSWFPKQMRRRLGVNTASSNLVIMRATAVDDIVLRARPTVARIDADVSVFDSPVFNVARYAGALNIAVLLVLTGLLFRRTPTSSDAVQLLATILTLFAAVQASRAEHPDGSTLRGLLSKASYWVMLASVLPTVVLAMVLTVMVEGQVIRPGDHRAAWATVVALVAQGLLMLRLRRGPLSRWRHAPPRVTLATGHAPDHARFDVLRGKRSRALVTEALLLGREAYAYVVTRPTGKDQFSNLLERTQSGGTRVEERVGRVAARATKLLATRGFELPRAGPVAAAQVALTGSGPANLLGVVQSATAGRAMTYLVFRERPATGWILGDSDADGVVEPVPLDPDRLAPMEPPEWVLEVLVGIPESAVAIGLAEHPLVTIVTATQRYNFRVTSVQLPAPPPPGGTGRRWMRLRVGVSYRRGDSLRGLGAFLYRLHRMDDAPFGDGTLSVIVGVNADEPRTTGRTARPLSDRDFDVVPDEEAVGDPSRHWRALAVTAHSRVGLLHDVLVGLAEEAPTFQLAGLNAAAVYGQTVLFMVGRDLAPPTRDAVLKQTLPLRVRPNDRLLVAIDERLTARTLDGENSPGDQLLLRIGLRTPDRPGVLKEMVRTLSKTLAEHAPPGVTISGLDVWFVLLQVINGRTSRGRLTIRLPGSPAHWPQWQAVDWAAVERSIGRSAAIAARADVPGGQLGWLSPTLDDTVVTAELLRTAVPAPLQPPQTLP